MEGYLILQRQVMEQLEQCDCHVVKLYLACHRQAAFKDSEMIENSTGRKRFIPRGSFITSTRQLSADLKIPHQRVRTALANLKKMGLINTASTQQSTHVSITFYDGVFQKSTHVQHTHNSKTNTVRSKEVSKELRIKTSTSEQIISDLPSNDSILEVKTMDKQPDPKEMAWVKDVLLKDLPLYLADENLMAVDPHTGQIRIMELVRQWKIAHPSANPIEVLKKAHAKEFCSTHKKRAGRAAWLNTWMQNEHSRGGIWKNGAITKDKKPMEKTLQETLAEGYTELAAVTQTLAASVVNSFTPAPPRRPIKPPVEDWTSEEANFGDQVKARIAASRQSTLDTPCPDRRPGFPVRAQTRETPAT